MRQRFVKTTQEILNFIKQQKEAKCEQIKLNMGNRNVKLFEYTLKKYI